jgi:hypothetical protein
MRRTSSIVCMVLVAFSLFTAAASASPLDEIPPSTSGGVKGKGATTDKYQVSYDSPIGGHWECTGIRIVNRNDVKDSFECTITDLATVPAGEYSGFNVPWFDGSGDPIWASDYDGTPTASLTLSVTDNGDGTGSVAGEAHYG